jgi:hypothetical protein
MNDIATSGLDQITYDDGPRYIDRSKLSPLNRFLVRALFDNLAKPSETEAVLEHLKPFLIDPAQSASDYDERYGGLYGHQITEDLHKRISCLEGKRDATQ